MSNWPFFYCIIGYYILYGGPCSEDFVFIILFLAIIFSQFEGKEIKGFYREL